MPMRLGQITYLNCAPYFSQLRECGYDGEIISGVPSELNAKLSRGEIDVCPSSSYEYGLHAADYLLLPGHSISSIGPVQSVLLFCAEEEGLIEGQEIALTGESATSVNLLKVLLGEFCGLADISLNVPEYPVEDVLVGGGAALLIGDRALRAAQSCPEGMQIIDLGALWYHFTGLPFVFALWIVRRDYAEKQPEAVAALTRLLGEARHRSFEALERLAIDQSAGTGFDSKMLMHYWQGVSYDLTDGHLEGLKLYFTLCQKHHLLDKVPDLSFVKT